MSAEAPRFDPVNLAVTLFTTLDTDTAIDHVNMAGLSEAQQREFLRIIRFMGVVLTQEQKSRLQFAASAYPPNAPSVGILRLPYGVGAKMFSFLSLADALRLARVSKIWREMTLDPRIFKASALGSAISLPGEQRQKAIELGRTGRNTFFDFIRRAGAMKAAAREGKGTFAIALDDPSKQTTCAFMRFFLPAQSAQTQLGIANDSDATPGAVLSAFEDNNALFEQAFRLTPEQELDVPYNDIRINCYSGLFGSESLSQLTVRAASENRVVVSGLQFSGLNRRVSQVLKSLGLLLSDGNQAKNIEYQIEDTLRELDPNRVFETVLCVQFAQLSPFFTAIQELTNPHSQEELAANQKAVEKLLTRKCQIGKSFYEMQDLLALLQEQSGRYPDIDERLCARYKLLASKTTLAEKKDDQKDSKDSKESKQSSTTTTTSSSSSSQAS